MAKITIRDIANMAGVSPAAVSFVINDRPGVSDETRRKIKKIIEKTGFQPSVNASRLVYRRSFNIALDMHNVGASLNDLFYVSILRGLLDQSKKYGYNIVFTEIEEVHNEAVLPKIIRNHDTDGIILMQSPSTAALTALSSLDIPFVAVDAHEKGAPYTCVYVDYELASFVSTSHLIENGHRKIAFISKGSVPDFYIQTFQGFCRAVEKCDISIPPDWIQVTADDEASAYACMERILSGKSIPTAVFCAVDSFAFGAMKCAQNHGFQVPGDISFSGVDNTLISDYFKPSLTTVSIDKERIGALAMDLIVEKIAGKTAGSVTVPSDNLVIRESVKRIICGDSGDIGNGDGSGDRDGSGGGANRFD
ncbi:MAG: LacI family transcriptional regulator [Clostridiales bacterium]|nr:LacI family transcriptional regulator [Clostridiales bacterium]